MNPENNCVLLQIEALRRKLELLFLSSTAAREDILTVSAELDKLIVFYHRQPGRPLEINQ